MKKIEVVLYKICEFLIRIVFGDKDNKEKIDALFQFAKFGIVGVTNTLISYFLNIVVLCLLSPYNFSWDYIVGNVVSFVLSVLWSFYWNKKFVFEKGNMSKIETFKMLLKTYAAYSFTGIFLSTFLSWLWIEKLGISKYIAPLLNLIISVPVNFIINKFWTFA